MFNEDFSAVMDVAVKKISFLKKNPFGYFLASMLAGIYVGLGIFLIYTIGGMLDGQPYIKIVMGASFGIALSLVIIAGAELFTSNNMVMAGAAVSRVVKWKDAFRLWIVCYLGNWAGAILLSGLIYLSGLTKGSTGEFITTIATVKMSIPLVPLFVRGVLCNILVCLAVWCSYRCKSESAKLIMIFWCLFAFITSGFEHSIANMTLLTVSLLVPHSAAISMSGYFYNIIVVSLGNMVGGILFLALPYFVISGKKEV